MKKLVNDSAPRRCSQCKQTATNGNLCLAHYKERLALNPSALDEESYPGGAAGMYLVYQAIASDSENDAKPLRSYYYETRYRWAQLRPAD